MIIPALAAGFAADLTNTIIQQSNSSKNMEKQDRYYKENATIANKRARQNVRDNWSLQAQSMRDAGLSPTSLAGSSPSPANVPTPAMGSALEGKSASFRSGVELANQTKLAEAQTRLTEAEAEKTETEVERMGSEDSTYDINLRNFLKKEAENPNNSQEYREFCKSLDENTTSSFNKGSFEGLKGYFDLSNTQKDTFWNAFKKDYDTRLYKLYESNGVPEVLANMSKAQYMDLMSKIGLTVAQTSLASSETTKNVFASQELSTRAQKNLAEALATYHGDLTQMIDAKDVMGIVVKLAGEAGEAAKEIAFMRFGGKFFKKVFGSASNVGGKVAREVAPTASRSMKTIKGVENPLSSQIKGIKGLLSNDPKNLKIFENKVKKYGEKEAIRQFHSWQSKLNYYKGLKR